MENDHKHLPGFLLASLLTVYPDADFPSFVQHVLEDKELILPTTIHSAITALLQDPNKLDDLRSEYIDIFDRGRAANPLYETEYGRDRALAKGNELADIAGFYKAFGLELDHEDGQREMLDHVAVELEFYALLLVKSVNLREIEDQTGLEIVWDARQKFLKEHLGRFVAAIAERPGVRSSLYYSQVFDWCRDLISSECQRMAVTSVLATWVTDSNIHSELSCGGSVGTLK